MSEPLQIAVVSGKGGVGKTMLSVAIANEMARGRRTLLIDLDFFNRGLTGLFASLAGTAPSRKIAAPRNLLATVAGDDWIITNVQEKLFVLSYGDVDKASSSALETMNVDDVVRLLGEYVSYACATAGCDVAVLDCHGGPDNTSFAACILSRYSILVSEPDKITLYGTLNFLRTLEALMPDRQFNMRLVFNKVIPAFNAGFLLRFYRQFLARQFAGHDLLAIFPLEAHLTKAFERTPFLTTVYPTSQLATKTRLLLCELLGHDASDRLPTAIRCPGRFSRIIQTYYMGRWPRVLELDFIFGVLMVVIVAFTLVNLASIANNAMPSPMLAAIANLRQVEVNGTPLFDTVTTIYFAFWAMFALGTRWYRGLDIWMTYAIRARSVVSAVGSGIAVLLYCLLWAALYINIAKVAWSSMSPVSRITNGIALGILSIPVAWFLVSTTRRGIHGILFDRRRVEGGFRLALGTVLPTAVILLELLLS